MRNYPVIFYVVFQTLQEKFDKHSLLHKFKFKQRQSMRYIQILLTINQEI